MKARIRRHGRWLSAVAFILYIALLFYLVFLSQQYGRNNEEILRYNDINMVPFRTINNYLHAWAYVSPSVIITNVFGNIVAFLPFGFFGPVIFSKLKKFSAVFISSFLLSLFIEVVQGVLGVGVVDVDDLILNVLGAVLGFVFYKICYRYIHR